MFLRILQQLDNLLPMTVNKIKILLPRDTDKEIDIPIQMTWDFLDRSNDLDVYEKNVVKEIINEDKDFEVARFEHNSYQAEVGGLKTDINYEFYFAPTGSTSGNTIWTSSYVGSNYFTPAEVYYYSKPFESSFFKLDFYDSTNQKEQVNYITVIIPSQQGQTEPAIVGYTTQNIKKPVFKLDFIGDKEGFFIYWLKKKDFLNINTFYMTAKYFDAKTGVFVKMMNRPQSGLTGLNKFNFNQEQYFYYKVILDYSNYTYDVYDINSGNDVLVGQSSDPIKWYEYINP